MDPLVAYQQPSRRYGRGRGRGRGGGPRAGQKRRNHPVNDGSAAPAKDTWPVRQMCNLLKRWIYSKYIRPQSSVLDACCGPLTDGPKFAHQRIASYIGIDAVAEALEEAHFRAKSTPIWMQRVKDYQFLQQDLRKAAFKIEPRVDTVCCQYALHYLWDSLEHIRTFLSSVEASLKPGGHFIITIVDEAHIPKEGIFNHPYVQMTVPESSGEEQRKCYRYTFDGTVSGVTEFVIPREELMKLCAEYSLKLVHSCRIRDVFPELAKMHPNPDHFNDDDWKVMDLYISYVFQKSIPAIPPPLTDTTKATTTNQSSSAGKDVGANDHGRQGDGPQVSAAESRTSSGAAEFQGFSARVETQGFHS
jgi:SAM-dependent methyltransferase